MRRRYDLVLPPFRRPNNPEQSQIRPSKKAWICGIIAQPPQLRDYNFLASPMQLYRLPLRQRKVRARITLRKGSVNDQRRALRATCNISLRKSPSEAWALNFHATTWNFHAVNELYVTCHWDNLGGRARMERTSDDRVLVCYTGQQKNIALLDRSHSTEWLLEHLGECLIDRCCKKPLRRVSG
jgi:hypothetical protein